MAEISYSHKRELYRVVVKAMLDKDGHKHFPKYTLVKDWWWCHWCTF